MNDFSEQRGGKEEGGRKDEGWQIVDEGKGSRPRSQPAAKLRCYITELEENGEMRVEMYLRETSPETDLRVGERVVDVFLWYDRSNGPAIRADEDGEAEGYYCRCYANGFTNCNCCSLRATFQECCLRAHKRHGQNEDCCNQ
eukprot:3935693-Rhodomonas_salina.1